MREEALFRAAFLVLFFSKKRTEKNIKRKHRLTLDIHFITNLSK